MMELRLVAVTLSISNVLGFRRIKWGAFKEGSVIRREAIIVSDQRSPQLGIVLDVQNVAKKLPKMFDLAW
jgi:hypothetical protein